MTTWKHYDKGSALVVQSLGPIGLGDIRVVLTFLNSSLPDKPTSIIAFHHYSKVETMPCFDSLRTKRDAIESLIQWLSDIEGHLRIELAELDRLEGENE